jgi:hypothetical protein
MAASILRTPLEDRFRKVNTAFMARKRVLLDKVWVAR